MSATAARRARLLRVRTIEHRIAAVRLATADAAHDAVARLGDRVARLRDGIRSPIAACHGHDLQSLTELTGRLDDARDGLARSLADSAAVCAARQTERLAAHVAEERTGRVHATALRREASARELRAAGASPTRLRKIRDIA
jgi:hypothetical protein